MKTIPEIAEECTNGMDMCCDFYCLCSCCHESTGCNALILSIDMIMRGDY
jgi:hypothetical protein